jgi:hypothetical protein
MANKHEEMFNIPSHEGNMNQNHNQILLHAHWDAVIFQRKKEGKEPVFIRMQRTLGPYRRECKMAATMENSTAIPQTTECGATTRSNNPPSEYTPKGPESRVSKRYWYTQVHSSVTYNSQKVEAAQVLKRKDVLTHGTTKTDLKTFCKEKKDRQRKPNHCV